MAPCYGEKTCNQECHHTTEHESPLKKYERRPRRSTSRISKSESFVLEPLDVRGQAILCFAGDRTIFRGTIIGNDGSNYSISGSQCKETIDDFYCDCNTNENFEDMKTFNVRLSDHDTPMDDYFIPQVHCSQEDTGLSFNCSSLSFTAEKTYRGQRAIMLANQNLGNEQILSGSSGKLIVYCGAISVYATALNEPKKWLL